MNAIGNQHFKLNKYLLSILGQSPFQANWKQLLIKTILHFIFIVAYYAQILGVIKSLGDIDALLECIPACCYSMMGGMLFTNYNLKMKEINIFLSNMQKDWEFLTSKSEVNILRKYANRSKVYNVTYTIGIIAVDTVFLLAHFLPQFYATLSGHLVPKTFPFIMEYNIDQKKYYYLILLHIYVSAYVFSLTILTTDTLLFISIEHACGIFDIIGLKLMKTIREYSNSNENAVFQKNLLREIKLCVRSHTRILLFIHDIQLLFSNVYLLVLGFCVILLSVTGVQTVMNIKYPKEVLRFGFYAIGQVLHILYLTVPTQHLLDASLNLPTCIYNADWYSLSPAIRKLLLIIMKKGSEPTTFVVGKIFALSMRSFTTILQTSMSYFTVLMSVRG